METEQGIYAQVVMLCQNYLKTTEENMNKNEDKLKFQGQSARSHCWFDIDYEQIEETFSTREPGIYQIIYRSRDETQNKNTFKMFVVSIVNAQNVEEMNFNTDAPILKYHQKYITQLLFQYFFINL